MMINCTTGDVVSGITLRFNGVKQSTNPKVTITSQMATYTIFTFANVTRSDNGLNISCTIEVGGNVRTLGHAILDVQCEFCVEIIGLLGCVCAQEEFYHIFPLLSMCFYLHRRKNLCFLTVKCSTCLYNFIPKNL